MVEVEKYIKRLLHDQDCVIIPDFGGVITHYLPARFDAVNGQYLPSQRKVAFNEVLKIDDGLLAKFISQNEGMSYEQAQRHIGDFVQTVQSLLKKNKLVTLNGIGNFRHNAEGRLVFQADQDRNFHSEFFGLQPVAALDRKNNGSATSGQVNPDEDAINVMYEAAPTRKIAWGNWISAASIACILVYVSAVLSNEPGATSSLNPVETIRTLFSGGAVSTEKVEELVPAGKTENANPVAIVEKPAPVVEEVVKEESLETAIVEKRDHRFFVIASVYESKSSFDKYGEQMADQLRKMGYEEIETLSVRDKYMLSAGSFATWGEAQKVIPKLSKTARGAWIYKKR